MCELSKGKRKQVDIKNGGRSYTKRRKSHQAVHTSIQISHTKALFSLSSLGHTSCVTCCINSWFTSWCPCWQVTAATQSVWVTTWRFREAAVTLIQCRLVWSMCHAPMHSSGVVLEKNTENLIYLSRRSPVMARGTLKVLSWDIPEQSLIISKFYCNKRRCCVKYKSTFNPPPPKKKLLLSKYQVSS